MNSRINYRYAPHHQDTCRGIAHWRGARAGLRTLSLPSCAAWLQRQANDPHYDFLPLLAVGGYWSDLPTTAPGPAAAAALASRDAPVSAPALPCAVTSTDAAGAKAHRLYLLQKEDDGNWMLAPVPDWPEAGGRPEAANSAFAQTGSQAAPRAQSATALNNLPAPAFIIEIS